MTGEPPVYFRYSKGTYKSSYEKLLDQAKLQSLHLGRLRSLATEIHNAVHGGAPPYVSSLFTERESEYSLRRNHSLILPPYNTISYGKQSIRYTGPKVWNSLPNNLRQTTPQKEFKNLISTWSGTNCTCSLCCISITSKQAEVVAILLNNHKHMS